MADDVSARPPGPVSGGVAAEAPSPSSPVTVLLVDDDADTRLMVRRMLERTRMFLVVGEAATGAEGVAMARTRRPAVAVLDVDLPGLSGLQVLPMIRQVSARTRVVLFSDRVSELKPTQVDRLGADLLVAKSPDLSGLVPALLRMSSEPTEPLLLPAAVEPRAERGSQKPYKEATLQEDKGKKEGLVYDS